MYRLSEILKNLSYLSLEKYLHVWISFYIYILQQRDTESVIFS